MTQQAMFNRLRQLERKTSSVEAHDALSITARYATDTAQSIPNTTWTIVNFDTATFDPVAAVTVGAAWKFTAPIGGYYQVGAFVEIEFAGSITTGDQFYMAIYVDGAEYSRIGRWYQFVSSANSDAYLIGGDLVYCAKDSYIDIRVYQDTGSVGALNGDIHENHVSVHLTNQTL